MTTEQFPEHEYMQPYPGRPGAFLVPFETFQRINMEPVGADLDPLSYFYVVSDHVEVQTIRSKAFGHWLSEPERRAAWEAMAAESRAREAKRPEDLAAAMLRMGEDAQIGEEEPKT